jgi:hypothetical protein
VVVPLQKATAADTETPLGDDPKKDLWNGIVDAPTFGLGGLVAFGDPENGQTPFSITAWGVIPISPKAHVRLRTGVPVMIDEDHLQGRFSGPVSTDGKMPDSQVVAEVEWGWPYFSIAAGAAYMYGTSFKTWEDYSSDTAYFDGSSMTNLAISLRGGKPSAAFYGRFSWPLPFILYDDNPDNYFIEFSALGVFGSNRFKAGIGLNGFIKQREANYLVVNGVRYNFYEDEYSDDYRHPTQGYESNYELTEIEEFMILAPTFRGAFLINEKLVLGIQLELAGTIFPLKRDYKPMGGIDLTYSLGTLKAPVILDGKF